MLIAGLRHTNAEKADPDENRILSEQGREQATARGKSASFRALDIDFACVSPVSRAMDTAQLTFGKSGVELIPVSELYMPRVGTWMRQELDRAYDKLGYASARKYFEYEGGLWLQRYAVAAASAVLALADARDEWRVGLVGHAICLNAIGAVLSPLHADVLLDLVLGEGHGFAISESGAFMVIND